MLGGLIRSTRYIEIETLENGNCMASPTARSSRSRLAWLIGRKQQRAIKAAFVAFNEAVRDRIEPAWKADHPDATSAA